MCISQAAAQSVSEFNPIIVCTEDIGDTLKAQGGCENGQNLHDAISGHAKSAAQLWESLYSGKARTLTSRAGKHDIIAPVSVDGLYMSETMSQRLIRAETPVFTDPETGLILFVNPDAYPGDKTVFSERAEVGFERALGLSVLTAYPHLQTAFSDAKKSPHVVAAGESLANVLSIGAHAGEPLPGVSFKRNFTRSLFETQGDKGNWDAGMFWVEAYKATNNIRDKKLPLAEYLQVLFGALNVVAEPPARQHVFYDGLDTVFQGFGWSRFPSDGFGQAYATAMAAHHIDPQNFISPEREITLKAQEITTTDVGHSEVKPFATEFLHLDIAGALLRETELNISLCEKVGDQCVKSEDIRLLFEGRSVDDRAGLKSFNTRRGDPVKVIDGNEIQMTLPSRREAFDINDEQFFSLKIGVANTDETQATKYQLTVQMAVREASCSWDTMAATLNPWWRGDLDSPHALIPNDTNIPAQFKMELSQELRGGWYLSEKAYRDDIGYDGQVFDKYLTEAKLRALTGDTYDVVVPIDYQTTPTDNERDSAFRQLMPSAAGLTLVGAINDGGTVCVSPVTVAEIPDFGDIENMSEADILSEMGLPPELLDIEDVQDGEAFDQEKLATIMAALLKGQEEQSEDMANDARDVMLQIYSPNLFTQQLGMLFPRQSLPLVHAGVGGWTPNAGFNMYVRLPGTAALDLAPGEYDAEGLIVPTFAISEDASGSDIEGTPPFYVWGERAGETINWRNYRAPKLIGKLHIKKQVSGAAIASLRLSGTTFEQDSNHPCNREYEDRTSLAPECEKANAGIENKGGTDITIDRMFLLGVSEGEPLPVQNMFNLTTARIPNPNTGRFE